MLELRLEVAGTGLDDGARSEAVSGKLCERDLGEIVEDSVAMLTGRTNVDVRAAGVAVLEQRQPPDYSISGNPLEPWKHSSVTQNAYVVERCLDCREHVANCRFGSVHRRRLSDVFQRGRGAGVGNEGVTKLIRPVLLGRASDKKCILAMNLGILRAREWLGS